MDIFLLRVFQRELLDQCTYLVLAADQIDASVTSGKTDTTFFAVQNFLNAGANISKLFWGQGGRMANQRKPLRDSVGIEDSSPLKDVTMRNNFEHMDERIDRWWKNSHQRIHAHNLIGPKSTIKTNDPKDVFRWFNPETADVIFWGTEFNLRALVNEVKRILPKLQEEANKPHWYQRVPK